MKKSNSRRDDGKSNSGKRGKDSSEKKFSRPEKAPFSAHKEDKSEEKDPRKKPTSFGAKFNAYGRVSSGYQGKSENWDESRKPGGNRSSGDRDSGSRATGNRTSGDRTSSDRASSDRASRDRTSSDRASRDRPSQNRPSNSRPTGNRPQSERISFGNRRTGGNGSFGKKPFGDKFAGDRPSGNRFAGDRPSGNRSSDDRTSGNRTARTNSAPISYGRTDLNNRSRGTQDYGQTDRTNKSDHFDKVERSTSKPSARPGSAASFYGKSDKNKFDKNERTARIERADRSERPDRAEKVERSEQAERGESPDRAERLSRTNSASSFYGRSADQRKPRSSKNRPERAERIPNSERPDNSERSERPERASRANSASNSYGRSDKPERAERAPRGERSDRPERTERAARGERSDRPERTERTQRAERAPRAERSDRPERTERAARGETSDRPERTERAPSTEGSDRPVRAERVSRTERSDRPERPERRSDDQGRRPRPYDKTSERTGDARGSSKKANLSSASSDTRLNKYIANAGICARRKADEIIAQGLIRVNGEVITEMGFKVKQGDRVQYQEKNLQPEEMIYVLLNKPKDFITTTDDPQERRTVMELINGASPYRIYPVGRLDRNTTGLLLFTNDGALAEKLSHPSKNVLKLYHVSLDKTVKQSDLDKIMEGLELEDGKITIDEISYVEGESHKEIGIQIHSGKNRIVRRIFEHLGYEVEKLDRVIYAGLTKKDLTRGRWRHLTSQEVIQLKHFLR